MKSFRVPITAIGHETLDNDTFLTELNMEDSPLCGELDALTQALHVAPSDQDDALQEARIHLYRLVNNCPNQSRQWYLTQCRSRLLRLLHHEDSEDVLERGGPRFTEDTANLTEMPEESDPLSDVVAHDLVRVLLASLPRGHLLVLDLIAKGWRFCEISDQLHISTTTIRKQRRQIASKAVELGIDGVLS